MASLPKLPTMSPAEKRWTAGAAALALLLVVVAWFFFISPQREQTADIEGQTADAQTQNITLQGRINRLQADSRNRSKYVAALAAARLALPAQSSISPFLRDVQSIATRASTRVTSLDVGEAEAFVVESAAAPPQGAATTSTPESTETPAAGNGGSSGIFAIPIDLSVTGSNAQLSRFLTLLQVTQPRAVLVDEVTRNAEGNLATLQIGMTAFVAPSTAPKKGA